MLQKIIEIIAPADCVACRVPGMSLCAGCAQAKLVRKVSSCVFCNRLTPGGKTCSTCARKTALRGAYILWRYEDYAKELVRRLKYANDRSVAKTLATYLVEAFELSDYEVITAVASDGPSLRSRGYNQSELLAKALAKKTGIPCSPVLLRVKHEKQVRLNRAQRLKAVEGNFVCFKPTVVTGKKVLIVDDVITTGATMNECAKVLKEAGAKRVWGIAVAKK
jgi:competence protein ComFC